MKGIWCRGSVKGVWWREFGEEGLVEGSLVKRG